VPYGNTQNLIAAESFFQDGNTAVTLERIDMVRRRANAPMMSKIDIESTTSLIKFNQFQMHLIPFDILIHGLRKH
jgi:hypothetical protein